MRRQLLGTYAVEHRRVALSGYRVGDEPRQTVHRRVVNGNVVAEESEPRRQSASLRYERAHAVLAHLYVHVELHHVVLSLHIHRLYASCRGVYGSRAFHQPRVVELGAELYACRSVLPAAHAVAVVTPVAAVEW